MFTNHQATLAKDRWSNIKKVYCKNKKSCRDSTVVGGVVGAGNKHKYKWNNWTCQRYQIRNLHRFSQWVTGSIKAKNIESQQHTHITIACSCKNKWWCDWLIGVDTFHIERLTSCDRREIQCYTCMHGYMYMFKDWLHYLGARSLSHVSYYVRWETLISKYIEQTHTSLVSIQMYTVVFKSLTWFMNRYNHGKQLEINSRYK